MTIDDALVLDALPAIHVARGDEYGAALEEKYSLRKRTYIPLLSVVTAGEMLRIARRLTPRERFERVSEPLVLSLISEFVPVEITGGVLRAYAKLMASLDSDGNVIRAEFGWVAATALVNDATIITDSTEYRKFGNLVRYDIIPRAPYF